MVVLGLFVFIVSSVIVLAGDLEPTAPPGPTMKTLDEVEPRIPINQADIPLTIAKSGSYYLVSDVNAAVGETVIKVTADNVTIDLMGYSLDGDGVATRGIEFSGRRNVEIRNGTVRNFVSQGLGMLFTTDNSENRRLINLRVVNNGKGGNSSGITIFGRNDLANFAQYWLDTGDGPGNMNDDDDVDATDYTLFADWWLMLCPDGWPFGSGCFFCRTAR